MQHYFLDAPDHAAPFGVYDPGSTVFESLEQAQQYVADLGEEGTWRYIHLGQWQFYQTGSTTPTRQIDRYGVGSSPEAALRAAGLLDGLNAPWQR